MKDVEVKQIIIGMAITFGCNHITGDIAQLNRKTATPYYDSCCSKLGATGSSSVTDSSDSSAIGVTNSWGNGLSLVSEIQQWVSTSNWYIQISNAFSATGNEQYAGSMFSTNDIYNDQETLADGDTN